MRNVFGGAELTLLRSVVLGRSAAQGCPKPQRRDDHVATLPRDARAGDASAHGFAEDKCVDSHAGHKRVREDEGTAPPLFFGLPFSERGEVEREGKKGVRREGVRSRRGRTRPRAVQGVSETTLRSNHAPKRRRSTLIRELQGRRFRDSGATPRRRASPRAARREEKRRRLLCGVGVGTRGWESRV